MTVFIHELKRNKLSLVIWSAILSFMLGICVIIYPEMTAQMGEISEMFANMGSFSAAFGMDQLNFGEFIGYLGIEYGNTLGLGGAFFAAIIGISTLSKEEKDRTAEFLLMHPISRKNIVFQKLASIMTQIIILNLAVVAVTASAMLIIGETVNIGTFALLILSYLFMQIEISAITFGISAFIRHAGLGIGLGISFAFYFLNIAANLSKKTEILKYITPFGYTDSAYIITNNALKIEYLAVGLLFTLLGICAAFLKYCKKDIS